MLGIVADFDVGAFNTDIYLFVCLLNCTPIRKSASVNNVSSLANYVYSCAAM